MFQKPFSVLRRLGARVAWLGGGGGGRKLFGGALINFLSNSGVKTKKEISSSQITACGYQPLAPFGARLLLGEHVHSLAGQSGILWCGSRFLPTNSGVKTKKGLWCEILGFVLAFTRVFRPEKRLYSRLGGGGHKQYFGRHRPEMHSSGTGPVTFFWGAILAWGDTSSNVGGTSPKWTPRWRRAWLCDDPKWWLEKHGTLPLLNMLLTQ